MSSLPSDLHERRAAILDLLERLHRHKDAAYGDAWRKRGEVIAIFANMARKYDRLLVAFGEERPAATEPLGDTIADLCVYAGKYLTWIAEEHSSELDPDRPPITASEVSAALGPQALRAVFDAVLAAPSEPPAGPREAWTGIERAFGALERGLMAQGEPAPPEQDLLSYAQKAILAWDLLQDTTWLLVYLEQGDQNSLGKLREEVAQMDEASTKP